MRPDKDREDSMPDSRFERDRQIALRVVHTRLTKIKLLLDRQSREFREDFDILVEQLFDLLLPYADEWITHQPWIPGKSRLVAGAEDLAERAANLGANRIRNCSGYYITLGIQERGLFWSWFRDVEKRMRPVEGDLGRMPDPHGEPVGQMNRGRILLLVRLLRLSRRSWTYRTLLEARDPTYGFMGRLSDCYLGRTANGGPRQARLVPLMTAWDQVSDELAGVLADDANANAPEDTVASFIRGLDSLTVSPGDTECGTVLDALLRQGQAGFQSTRFPALAQALPHAANGFGPIQSALPGLICSAIQELGSEIDAPGSTLPPAALIQQVLDRLDAEVRLERAPIEVLACIGGLPVVLNRRLPHVHAHMHSAEPPDDPGPDRIPDRIRLALSLTQFDLDDPCWDIIVNLGIGHGLQDFAVRLASYLDGPDRLERSLLPRILAILKDWDDETTRGYRRGEDEVESGLRKSILVEMIPLRPHLDQIAAARQLVQDWIDGSVFPPSSWSGLPEGIRRLLLAALLITLLDDIRKALYLLYEADKTFRNRDRDALDASDLVESILGPDHVAPVQPLDPIEVRDRLIAKAGEKRIHVMAIAMLPCGRFVTGDTTGAVCVWEVHPSGTLDLIARQRQGRTVFALEVFPDGLVAAARDDGTVTLWDPLKDPGAEQLRVLEDHQGFVLALARLGDQLVAGDQAGQVTVWDPSTGLRRHVRRSHLGPVRTLATHGVSEVFSGGEEGSINAWDLALGSIGTIGKHDGGVLILVAYPPNLLLSGGQDRAVRAWDITRWQNPSAPLRKQAWSTTLNRAVTALAAADGFIVSADGNLVAGLSSSGTVATTLVDHGAPVNAVAIRGNDVFSCGDDGTTQMVSIGAQPVFLITHDSCLRCLTTLPGGTSVFAGADDGRVLASLGIGRTVSAMSPPR
jgi:hypothetical protein